jgi:hypothetical protein
VSVDAAVAKGVDDTQGPEFVHTGRVGRVPEE